MKEGVAIQKRAQGAVRASRAMGETP